MVEYWYSKARKPEDQSEALPPKLQNLEQEDEEEEKGFIGREKELLEWRLGLYIKKSDRIVNTYINVIRNKNIDSTCFYKKFFQMVI